MSHPSEQRRTFAIISHPDAGKTTLTEKLLLYGGAVHQAGAVKSRKSQRAATSDWMEIEKKRGISVTSSVLMFQRNGVHYNLLDTPGHQDFSEDTYRTLTAADCAIMLIDAAKGVEAQTRKLFDVCRKRGTPIVTFVNKLDRPARDQFNLMSEVEEVLGIHTTPRTWPIGSGDLFKGVYDLANKAVLLFENTSRGTFRAPVAVKSLQDPSLADLIGEEAAETLRAEVELLEGAGEPYERTKFLRGQQTPVYCGSALTNFGIEPFLDSFVDLCPAPGPQLAGDVIVQPTDDRFSGFIFKVQANMDPAHRDRIAFLRVCSGKFESDIEVHHYRLGKDIRLKRPQGFFGQEREAIDEAWAGDVIGLFDPGIFRIGDTLSTKGPLCFETVPRFSPEHFARLRLLESHETQAAAEGHRAAGGGGHGPDLHREGPREGPHPRRGGPTAVRGAHLPARARVRGQGGHRDAALPVRALGRRTEGARGADGQAHSDGGARRGRAAGGPDAQRVGAQRGHAGQHELDLQRDRADSCWRRLRPSDAARQECVSCP
ncbi:MAG: peptide chain release factor 3 [Myxococcales bacterium]